MTGFAYICLDNIINIIKKEYRNRKEHRDYLRRINNGR